MNQSIADKRVSCSDSQLKLADLVTELSSIVKDAQENQKHIRELSVKTGAIESTLNGILRKLNDLTSLLDANQNINQTGPDQLQVNSDKNIDESSLVKKSDDNSDAKVASENASVVSVAGTESKDRESIAVSLNADNLSNLPNSDKSDEQPIDEKSSVVPSEAVRNVVEESKREKVVEGSLTGARQGDSIQFENVCVLKLDPKTKKSTNIGSFCTKLARMPNAFQFVFTDEQGTYYFYLKHDEKIILSDKYPNALTFRCYWSEEMAGDPDTLFLKFRNVSDKQIAHAFIGKDSH